MQVGERMVQHQSLLARYKQILDRLDNKFMPSLWEMADKADARMADAEGELTPEDVVRREAHFVRQLVRLAARLKPPFPQFALRDHFDPKKSNFHHRQAVLQAIQRVEYADHCVFHQVLIPNRKRERRLSVRMSPTVVIVPACGLMGS